MSNTYIPEGYRSPLNIYDMQCAIEFIKGSFQDNLKRALNLRRVSAPLFVRADSDALIVRGILSIAVSLLNGRTPEEILAYRPRYIGETNIKRQISTDRFHGIQAAIGMIQRFAAACQTGGES